jgi:small subunit ribosomal protein S9
MAEAQKEARFYATGKRKRSIARVYLYPEGKGDVQVNKSNFDTYFPQKSKKMIIQQPLVLTKLDGKVDLYVNVSGGGKSGQAEAIRHGISKALIEYQPELRKTLKAHGFLTRDARKVERKKPGMKGARASYQFSKR